MAKMMHLELWQLRDAYFYWWSLTDDTDSDRRLWDFYMVSLGIRDIVLHRRGGR